MEEKTKIMHASALASFIREEMDIELSDFRCAMILDFVLERIGAEEYNKALLDCRAYMTNSLEDMEAALFKAVRSGK